jgi:DNA-binding NtrC family response regulator
MSLEGRTIAVIEDDPIMGESLAQSLSLEGAKVCLYRSGQAALRGAAPRSFDLVVCDIRLPDTDGQTLFHHFGMGADMPPFLFMTAFGDINQAVALMREGAADYLTKPFDMADFLRRVQSSLRPPSQSYDGETALGVSPPMRDIEHLLRLVSRVESPVLITGETGTGKEVCARFLHALTRKSEPFMAVNCAAIPSDLLESELFGHEAGAFTGAGKRHLGFAERAGEGTLFLDEIGELALPLQAKLLRVLEERQFYRLGGETPVSFKARLVSATNADLSAQIIAKQFRPDLYYRVNVVEVKVPPLRERRQDIPWLLSRFLGDLPPQVESGTRGISAPAEQAVLSHSWPGNVRELRNRLERAVALNLTGWILPQDLFPESRASVLTTEAPSSLADAREAAERQRIAAALAENRGQIGKTAGCLGVSRTTLWEKMKRYGLAGDTS